jgi:hypothetical protein
MLKLITHWLLVFALFAQSIGEFLPDINAVDHSAALQLQASSDGSGQQLASENSHCHDAVEAGQAQLPTDENDAPMCACCDDNCSMPRCQSVALLVDEQVNYFLAHGSAAPTAQPAVRWLMRLQAPPTPPPNALLA